tara:strand:+ start:235 stop:468 length:234 start_codon:yes stop_codon:yes gene_type:complete
MSDKGIDLLTNYKDMLERNIMSMEHKLNHQKLELQEVILYLTENCHHQFDIDYVDSMKNGESMSQMIKYCKKCELSF